MASIASKASAAAEALSSEAEAPANDCCAAGQKAFATSESVLEAEYTQMVNALNEAAAELSAQAEANEAVWVIAEQKIQTCRACRAPSSRTRRPSS